MRKGRNVIKELFGRVYRWKNSAWGLKLQQLPFVHALKELFRIGVGHVLGAPPDRNLRDLFHERRVGELTFARPVAADDFTLVLIQPPLPANRRHKRIVPLGLAYLASFIGREVPRVNGAILDAQLNDLNLFECLSLLRRHRVDAVGITSWTVQFPFVQRLVQGIRQEMPGVKVVLGGVHPSVRPGEAAAIADAVVMFEGEETFAELLRAMVDGDPGRWPAIRGLAYRDAEGRFCQNPRRERIGDLDRLPFPALDLLDIHAYDMPLHVLGGERLPIIASRGCPYDCSFCVSPVLWERKVKWRSAANVLAEMQEIGRKYGIRFFHFWDDNFTLGREFVREFCTRVLEAGMDIKWVCLDRAEHLVRNADLLPLMKRAGCVGIEIGMESANPDTYLFINKQQGFDEVQKANAVMRETGLAPLYTCMAMNPGETINGYHLQKRALDRMQEGLPWFQFFHPLPFPLYIGQFATPYPDTGFARQVGTEGRLLADSPEDTFHHQINFVPRSLLDDVPLRNAPALPAAVKRLVLYAFWRALWLPFDRENSLPSLKARLREANRFLIWFWDRANGKRPLDQISTLACQELNFPDHKACRFCALAAYLLGQLGWIRSAVHNVAEPIRPIPMALPLELELQLRQVLLFIE
ncbi:MAG: B12-binding domain-containing radical SAM protein [Candidatus Riflebacteria bacterium]|nr:B12-binding domain-containing radical SAM protein [Candidatus Riflebacteria bacterium]